MWSIALSKEEEIAGDVALKLLKSNAHVKLGAWQIARVNHKWTAVFEAQIAADTDKTTILTALLAVTNTADKMEKELTEADEF